VSTSSCQSVVQCVLDDQINRWPTRNWKSITHTRTEIVFPVHVRTPAHRTDRERARYYDRAAGKVQAVKRSFLDAEGRKAKRRRGGGAASHPIKVSVRSWAALGPAFAVRPRSGPGSMAIERDVHGQRRG